MALVDWEAVVLDVQAHVRSKNSHGQRELTDFVADSVARHRQAEGLVPRALRLYGPELLDQLTELPAPETAVGPTEDGREAVRSS